METPEQTAKLEKAAKSIADLVEDEAWEHMSMEDSAKALAVLRELIRTFPTKRLRAFIDGVRE